MVVEERAPLPPAHARARGEGSRRLWFQCAAAAAILHQAEKGKTDRSSSAAVAAEGAKRAFDEEEEEGSGMGMRWRMRMEAIEAIRSCWATLPSLVRPTLPRHDAQQRGRVARLF